MEPWTVEEVCRAVNGRLLKGEKERVVRWVSYNSREIEKEALFVPIIGEKADGHNYMEAAMRAGASAAFTSRHKTGEDFTQPGAYISVEDTLRALQDFGRACRNRFPGPIVGITGSVGKTTTKEMIAAALETRKCILKTQGNMNSQIGLPVMMTRFLPEHQLGVIEMGISVEGEMERLVQVARPEMAVITNIGVSHIGQLGSKENIRKEKAKIIHAWKEKGVLILNGDDPLLAELGEFKNILEKNPKEADVPLSDRTKEMLVHGEIITYGMGQNCTYRAEGIEASGNETRFTCVYPEGREEIVLGVLGSHNVGNALAALAVAGQFGIPVHAAKEGLRDYRPMAMRGEIRKKNGITVIDDTYNASPDSMISGIEVLLSLPDSFSRIAVLADVKELGEASYSCHYEVGEYILKAYRSGRRIDEVVTIGKEARVIAQAVEYGSSSIATHSFSTNQEAAAYLKHTVKAGTAVLVKGSRSMHTDEIVNELV